MHGPFGIHRGTKLNTETPKCTVPNCERGMRRKALGLCEPHAEDYRAERGEYCAAEGCERGHIKGGYCGSHYSQKDRGKELTPLQKRRPRRSGPAKCGTRSAYELGCRCAECREAKRIEAAEWRAAYKQKHGRGYYEGRKRNRKVYERTCDFCAHDFTTKTHIARYCSLECAKRDAAGWSKAKDIVPYVSAPKPTQAPTTVIPSNNWYTAGTCRVCGDTFVSQYMHVTCSTQCQDTYDTDRKREARHRRRARLRNAYRAKVTPSKVYERDGYKCHLCGKRTKADAKAPHPQAPTLDHIVPLAQGGTHEPSNVATACFICNSRKGDRMAGDQLLLFG